MPLLSLLGPFIRLLYRLRVFGRERVPRTGGCLIVCNHVSLIDREILKAASPRRLRFASNDDPQAIADALDRGEAVLVFPEGNLTRSGHMLPWSDIVEQILARTKWAVPVIPACTDGLWGGIFSYHGGKILWKLPRDWRPHIGVMFGEPLTPSPRRGEGDERRSRESGEGESANPSPRPLSPTGRGEQDSPPSSARPSRN